MSLPAVPGSLADPAGSSVVAAAVGWLQGTLLGTAATSVAVICIASVGLMMLSGRIGFRRAGSVLLGAFVLFGASSIAAGIHQVALGAGPDQAQPFLAPPPDVPPAYVPPPPPPAPAPNADPFAGAAVPPR